MGEDDPALIAEIGQQKLALEAKHEALSQELQTYWKEWDAPYRSRPRGIRRAENWRRVRDKMVDVLNRRNYIRNLVRDVNEAMED